MRSDRCSCVALHGGALLPVHAQDLLHTAHEPRLPHGGAILVRDEPGHVHARLNEQRGEVLAPAVAADDARDGDGRAHRAQVRRDVASSA